MQAERDAIQVDQEEKVKEFLALRCDLVTPYCWTAVGCFVVWIANDAPEASLHLWQRAKSWHELSEASHP